METVEPVQRGRRVVAHQCLVAEGEQAREQSHPPGDGCAPDSIRAGPDRHEQPSLGTSANLTSAAAEGSELGVRDHAELGVGQFGDLQVETGHVLLSASSAPEMENLV